MPAPQFLHLENGGNDSTNLTWETNYMMLGAENSTWQMVHMAQFLLPPAPIRGSTQATHFWVRHHSSQGEQGHSWPLGPMPLAHPPGHSSNTQNAGTHAAEIYPPPRDHPCHAPKFPPSHLSPSTSTTPPGAAALHPANRALTLASLHALKTYPFVLCNPLR